MIWVCRVCSGMERKRQRYPRSKFTTKNCRSFSENRRN